MTTGRRADEVTAPAIDRMADHQVSRIRLTFDADFGSVKSAFFFRYTVSTFQYRRPLAMMLNGSLGIRASPVSAAGFPQDSDIV